MKELVEYVVSWPSFLLVVLVFGFLPGFTLRLILMLYPRDDTRRRELLAELYAMPRVWRPVWVAQQIETAAFEGPRARTDLRRKAKAKHHRVDRTRISFVGLLMIVAAVVAVGAATYTGVISESLGSALLALNALAVLGVLQMQLRERRRLLYELGKRDAHG